MLQLIPGQHIHFVGIGGAGLSAIARVLLDQGFTITGSDMRTNAMTDAMVADGAEIHRGHDAAYVGNAEIVVISSAIPDDHIEVLTAMSEGIPVYKRSDIMEAVMRGHYNIAVAGTHGKTTTTSMIAHILLYAKKDPSYIIGGTMGNNGKNAAIGSGSTFVIEADEYDNMFHGLRPNMEVITNVEYDHPDFFKTPHESIASFSRFVGLLPAEGVLVGCMDDPIASIFLRNRMIVALPTATYGITNRQAEWRADNIRNEPDRTVYTAIYNNEILGDVTLKVPGEHNVLNSLAALIVTHYQDIDFETGVAALAEFKSSGRRFDVRGEKDGVLIVDDYAHHPTEIRATIKAARQRYPNHEIWAVWQPHTYSRVQKLLASFLTAFDAAHHVLITEIYAAREQPIEGVSSLNVIAEMQHPHVRYTANLEDVTEVLREEAKSPAIVLVMSAGDATRIAIDYLSVLETDT